MSARVLVVDNHDSFVFILVDYLRGLDAEVTLVEADEIDAADAAAALAGFDGVLVSPGPGTPRDAGASIAVVRAAVAGRMPLLGVCLGHQALAEAFGAIVGPAPELVHGSASRVAHDGAAIFRGMPQGFLAGRYHSLAVEPESLPQDLVVTAWSGDRPGGTGIVMGLAHRDAPAWGVQFHPESVLTEDGRRMLANWLDLVSAR